MAEKRKRRIAIIAHDGKKSDMMAWCFRNEKQLKDFELFGTGTTAKKIQKATSLKVEKLLSGPQGGDQQIGAMVASEEMDIVIFFRDPLTAQPHEPDISALLRICDVHNTALATNFRTADMILKSLGE